MNQQVQDYFEDFRQVLMANAAADSTFQLGAFAEKFANAIMEAGYIDGFEFCHYRAQGMQVDGYYFSDEDALDLIVADFNNRTKLAHLDQKDANDLFDRLVKFLESSLKNALYTKLEETSPEYDLARQIYEKRNFIRKVNLHLISERLSDGELADIEDRNISGIPAFFNVWDMSRICNQHTSGKKKEILEIDFIEIFGTGLDCLSADIGQENYESYLVVVPGNILADLYDRYGARLLEQNVRVFLQARGKVNQGIRATILNEPDMFFAYNNGITATAQKIERKSTGNGMQITRIRDFQIVNGGQTTASLFHTRRRGDAPLDRVFVQLKLSVIPGEGDEEIVAKISEYANTQNRVNAADFFANHPFHKRIEDFSKRIWAPPPGEAQRGTKWFYERARGQYADAQSQLSSSEQKRFRAEHPRNQMFTKTDLAKFENVWDDQPRFVNLGAQKNFAQYAKRIGGLWKKSGESKTAFNEDYFRRIIARAVFFRQTEKIVSDQPWYGGYRAQIVAYSIAFINEYASRHEKVVDFEAIWHSQSLSPLMMLAIEIAARIVNDDIKNPPESVSNISEWCKTTACWDRLKGKYGKFERSVDPALLDELISIDEDKYRDKTARGTQKIDDGIEAQKKVISIPVDTWKLIQAAAGEKNFLTEKERGIVKVATQMPEKIPSDKQSIILLEVLEKCRLEGIPV